MAKFITIVLGLALLIAAIGLMAILYHLATQQMWHDIMREEFQRREDREIERRWRNQDIRVHVQMVIVDEMDHARQNIKHHKRVG